MTIIVCAVAHPGGGAHVGSDELVACTYGESHYSYQIVLNQFRPVLESLDTVVSVMRPEEEVGAIVERCEEAGEPCVFLSFAPPQLTPMGLSCRTIPVFAWEFPDIPVDAWGDDPRNSWRNVFQRVGSAITHSRFSADAVRREMGADYPVLVCPSPVWDRFQAAASGDGPPSRSSLPIPPSAFAIDTGYRGKPTCAATGLSASLSIDLDDLLESVDRTRTQPPLLEVEGVVYTSVFNPADFRKNWERLVTSFCRAFRDTPDAVLILKFVHRDHGFYLLRLQRALYKMSPFRCRVIAIGGFLDDPAYEAMVRATTYALNASTGEGQCLPLMEFMSCGKPAVAPRHTAMIDYVGEDDAFLVEGFAQETGFPQDPRGKLLTSAFQFESDSLVRALRESHRIAGQEPERYRQLSENAVSRLGEHCSRRVAGERLRGFLGQPARRAGDRESSAESFG